MSTKDCLQQLYDEEMNCVFALSADYTMTTANRGYEKEHAYHVERAEILKTLMDIADRLGD